MAEINDLNVTDASNTARWPEGMAPSAVNNAGRADEGLLARWHKDINGSLVTTGSANAYVLAANRTISAYYDGLSFTFEANFAITGAATLNVDAVGAQSIVMPDQTTLVTGDIVSGQKCKVVYDLDNTNWILMSPPAAVVTTQNFPAATITFPRGHIDGLILSNNTTDASHDIDISAGDARDDGDAANLSLSATLVKRIDASWVVGTNQGGLDGTESVAGTPDASTWYHVWAIRRSDTGVTDVLFSESATSPTLPTDYDQKRRIGAVLTDVSANITAFTQDGDWFYWVTRTNSITANTPGISAVTSPALRVPTGLQIKAYLSWMHVDDSVSTSSLSLVSSLDETDQTPAAAAFTTQVRANGGVGSANNNTVIVRTNTSAEVRYRVSPVGDAAVTLFGSVIGWIDPRGKDA